jgi:hypothetical protein
VVDAVVMVSRWRIDDRALNLNRAARGHHGGGDQRGHVAGAGGQRPGRDDRASGAGGRRGSRTRGRATTRSAAQSKHLGRHPQGPEGGRQSRELPAHSAHLASELPATRTVTKVASRIGVRTGPAIVGDDQLLTDVGTRRLAGRHGLSERHPCPNEQRLDRRHRDPERIREVGVRHPSKLAHQQSRALLGREASHVLDQAAERLALVGLGDRILDRRADELHRLGRRRRRAPELVDAAVVGHPVEPGPESQLTVVGAQVRIGPHEDVLQRILGVLAPRQHLAGVSEQALPVAVMDHPEGLVMTGSEQRHQLVVGAQPE